MTDSISTNWPGGIIQVKVPLPFSLKWVNSYLLTDERGYCLIDPGLHTPEAVAVWTAALVDRGIGFTDIHTIILTHQHPDHYGLSGWFQQHSGAPVMMSGHSYAYAVRLWGADRFFASELSELYALNGMPQPVVEQIGPHLEGFVQMVSPQPKVTLMAAGDTILMGGREWETIDAPGHARGQLCFYSPERRWMICGDQVLPDITPNISVVPGEDSDPLQQYKSSLAHLRTYDVAMAFPGHRDPFSRFEARVAELLEHHERRLAEMIQLLKEEPFTGYQMCERLFGSRIAGNIHNLRFAMSETLAHLVHLERNRKAVSEIKDGIIVYQA